MIRPFAVTTRGLESVSAEEIAALPQTRVVSTGYRRVIIDCAGPLPPLLDLRTAEDIFLSEGTWLGIGSERTALASIREMAAQLSLYRAAGICEAFRPFQRPPVFSVTANFVGGRNYTTDEIKLACAAGVEAGHSDWTYTADDREADLNVRLFIEHDTADVGIRLGSTPLQNRAYKQAHVPGSLRPPVAAAMARLADLTRGHRVLDPCCGAATLLIEAAHYGAGVLGGDVDGAAIEATRANAAGAAVAVACHLWDARALPLADATIDGIITNPPWGRKVEIDADLSAFYADLGREIARVLKPTGKVVVLTWAPAWVRAWNLRCLQEIEISLYGRRPTIAVLAHPL